MVDGVFTVLQGADAQLTVNDMPEGADFENLGTTVEVITQGGSLAVGGKTFDLQQFHFHLPSEHLDNGTSQASRSISQMNTGIQKLTPYPSGNAHGLPIRRARNRCHRCLH